MVRFFVLTFILFCVVPLNRAGADDSMRIGTTFSPVQCEYLGIDWKETFEKVINLDMDILRLGAYWSRIEKKENEFDFSELDWQIQKAKEKRIPILLTVGMKAPRWPEYFIPSWLEKKVDFRFGSDISEHLIIQQKTLAFIEQVVRRYENEEIIVAWQVENEPLSRSGPKELWIRKNFLRKEIQLVQALDPGNRQVVINAMTYPNRILSFLTRLAYKKNPVLETIDVAQNPALNVYPAIGHKVMGQKICFWTNPESRIKYLQQFVDYAHSQKKSVWVTELQAEPWEPGELVHTRKEAAVTCGADHFVTTFEELKTLNIKTIFLWGVEYWVYRLEKYQDDEWIKTFKRIVANH